MGILCPALFHQADEHKLELHPYTKLQFGLTKNHHHKGVFPQNIFLDSIRF